jgi:sigma-B regulation protein RsbU (phosphoserine phosphatase)
MDRAAAPTRLADLTGDLRLAYQRLTQAYRQIDADREAAQRVQRRLQPRCLPELPGIRFGTYSRPCGRPGGDCYGAFRVDENQVGFYLATVVGNGVAAALVTVWLRALQMQEALHHQPVAPDEALQRLNRELLDMALPDPPFLTAIHGILDGRDGTLRFARAGHSCPIVLPSNGPARLLSAEGNLLGVFPTRCAVHTSQLQVGERLLLYTDGLAPRVESAAAADRLLAAVLEYRSLPIQEHVERAAQELIDQSSASDDATLLAVEWAPAAAERDLFPDGRLQ